MIIEIILILVAFGCFGGAILTLIEGGNKIFAVVLVVVGIVVIGGSMCITSIDAGNVGVRDTFGNVDDTVFFPGLVVKNPFTNVVQMNTKTQEFTEVYSTLTSEGLDVSIDLTLLYKLSPTEAVDIYKTVGTSYADVIIRPQLRSVVRDVIAEYEAKDIYSSDRTTIATKIQERLFPICNERGIITETILIRSVTLPTKISDAIQQKLEAEQKITEKQFEVKTEEMEADRKRAEAHGIADAQAIIDESLTEEYLKWYWIESMRNRPGDTYYVPIGNDGLPIMATVTPT